MSYSELKNTLENHSTFPKEQIKKILEDYEKKIHLDSIKNKCVLNLSIDLINDRTYNCEFELTLDKNDYDNSNNYAYNCLDISLTAVNIPPRKIKDWLNNSLICYDILLLNYISKILSVNVSGSLKEKEVYIYLSGLTDNQLKKVGKYFDHLYRERNSLTHVQFITKNGQRKVKNFTNDHLKAKLNYILELYNQALIIFLVLYRDKFAQYKRN